MVIKTLDPDPDPDSLEMADPDPNTMNSDPQHCQKVCRPEKTGDTIKPCLEQWLLEKTGLVREEHARQNCGLNPRGALRVPETVKAMMIVFSTLTHGIKALTATVRMVAGN